MGVAFARKSGRDESSLNQYFHDDILRNHQPGCNVANAAASPANKVLFKVLFHFVATISRVTVTASYRHMQKRQENHGFVYLKHIDWDGNDNIEQVSQSQAANQDIGPVPHALVLVYDPEQRRVPNDAHHEDQAGDDGVHVLEGVPDFRGLKAHRWGGASWPRWHFGWWWWRWCGCLVSGKF